MGRGCSPGSFDIGAIGEQKQITLQDSLEVVLSIGFGTGWAAEPNRF